MLYIDTQPTQIQHDQAIRRMIGIDYEEGKTIDEIPLVSPYGIIAAHIPEISMKMS